MRIIYVSKSLKCDCANKQKSVYSTKNSKYYYQEYFLSDVPLLN